MHVALVIPLIGLDTNLVGQFADSVRDSQPSACYEIVPVVRPATDLPNISEAKNAGIRRASWADVVVCADADVRVSPGLLDWSCEVAMGGKCAWQYPVDVGGGEPPSRRICSTGAWNAMTYANWVRVGGWDERCRGWGGEDDVLHRDIRLAGIAIEAGGHVLAHERHGLRSANRSQENMALAQPTLWNWLVPNGHICICVTSACNLSCRHCAMKALLDLDRGYMLSLADVVEWLGHTVKAGYRFHKIVLTGGEPTLNPELPAIVRAIHQADICEKLKLFTNGAKFAEMQTELYPYLDLVSVSDHGQALPDIESWGERAWVADRTEHYPHAVAPVTTVTDCVGGAQEYLLYDGRVYLCPCGVAISLERGMHVEADAVRPRYLDRLLNFQRFGQPACQMCCANRAVRAVTGSWPV